MKQCCWVGGARAQSLKTWCAWCRRRLLLLLLLTFASRTGSGTYSGRPNEDAAAPSFLPLAGRHTGARGCCSRGALLLRCMLPLRLAASLFVCCGASLWYSCGSGVNARLLRLAADTKGLCAMGLLLLRSSCASMCAHTISGLHAWVVPDAWRL